MQGVTSQSCEIKTKSQLKKLAKEDPFGIVIEATSAFGNEFDGMARDMPEDKPIYVVGPDPYTSRKWYATIVRKGNTLKVS